MECELGVCDSSTGTCENPGTCDDDTLCLAGYECESGQCVADFACAEDTPCERGVCEGGACINPDSCDVDDDCVGGFACDGDVCVADACADVTCERGVCERESGECVNSAVCTAETQAEDCLEGNVCYDQTCQSEASVCDEINCSRGACDIDSLSCVNSDDCAGDDRNCLSGFICGDDNTCIANVCEANMVDCARGVCEAATGTCVNAESCSALSDCRDGFYCVDSACIEMDVACEVCVGNQVCDFDEGSVEVVCGENPAGCVNTIDCVGTNVCSDGTCAAPLACVPDANEPNDTIDAAADWFAVAVDGGITGSVCSGDSDFFTYDLAQDPEFTGTLVAQVIIPASDVGIGTLTLALHGPDGAVVATNTSQIDDADVRVEYTIGNINQGIYTLAVSDGGDAGVGGINYTVFMDLVDATAATACSAAQVATTGVMGDTSQSQSNTLGSACTNVATGNEDAWILDVPVDSFVTIDVTGVQFDAVISLRNQCESDASEFACVNDGGARVRETLSRKLDAGQYSLLIQGTDGAESGAYALQINQQPIICTSADNSCSDASTAVTCNSRGTAFDTVACDAGCEATTGTCIREPGDVCASAIDATGGFSGNVPIGSLTNEYDPGTSCVPEDSSGSVTDGPDAVFAVTLQDGDLLYATADPTSFDYIGMYLVSDCVDVATSCVLGVNASSYSGAETLTYENTSGAAQDFFLVVDSDALANSSVDVEIEIGPALCSPGTVQCNGSALETCAESGLSYDSQACTNGCDPTLLRCIPPANDSCGGAIDISAGGQWTGTIEQYTNEIGNARNCTGYSSGGPDAMYMITGTPGQIATITAAAPFDVALYAASNCGDVASSCIDGDDDGGSGTTEEIEFRLDGVNPVYVFVDSISSTPTGQFTLDVTLRNADCLNYEQAVSCQVDGTTLQICNELGAFEDYACDTTCVGSACSQPSGDRCADAVVLTTGQSFTGSFSDVEGDYDPGVGSCVLTSSDRQRGPDTTFAIDLVAGDLLTAELSAGTTLAGMWVMSDCADVHDTCLIAAPRSEELEFYANATGRYYLVVDSTSTTSTGAFTVSVDIQSGFACQPGGATCDEVSGTLTTCNDAGTAVTGVTNCPNGCLPSGHCNGATVAPDTCVDATVVNGSVSILDNYGRFTNVFDPGAATNACGLTDTDGPDAVYQVTLAPNDVIDVSVDDLGGSGSPRVYIATDCTDVATSCLASESDFATVRAAHISAAGGTVYVVVDSGSTSVTDPFLVDIDVRQAECVPSTVQCTGANTGESCNEYAQLEPFDCYFGCANGVCNPPTNNTCASPVDATGGASFSIEIDGYTDTYDPGYSGCTAYYADGPDGVFKVTLAQDEVIEVIATSNDFDISVYLTTTCGVGTTCAVGQDVGYTGAESFMFRAPTAGDYYVHVDTSETAPTGRFSLVINYPTPVCTAGTMTCDVNGQNIEACNDFGTGAETLACDAQGCIGGASFCTNADGETCAAAIDATAAGTFTGSFANFSNDYSLDSFSSCTGWSSAGPEAVYYVDLLAGQTLTATLSSLSDTSLWLTRSCVGAVDACLVGADDAGSDETVTYTATGAERVFIFADNYSSSVTDAYTLTVAIQ